MKEGVNIHRVAGYGKKLEKNTKVVEKIERFQEQISKLKRELDAPLNEIGKLEEILQSKIKEERIYREIYCGERGEEAFRE